MAIFRKLAIQPSWYVSFHYSVYTDLMRGVKYLRFTTKSKFVSFSLDDQFLYTIGELEYLEKVIELTNFLTLRSIQLQFDHAIQEI